MIIGLTGTKASGKGVVAEILREKEFLYSSLSDRVREEAVARGIIDYTTADLQDIGNELRKSFGNGVLAIRTLALIKENENCVIDGIRNTGEIEELKKTKEFILIAVDAPLEVRFERLMKRNRASDPKTWEEFIEMDKRDRGLNENDAGQQVAKCMELATYKIFNDCPMEELVKKINELAEQIVRRPSWDEYFLKMAALVAERSTCLRHHMGAVIVKNKRVLTTGYNGAARGMPDCTELGCLRNELGIPSGQRHEICRAIHAEQNAIIQAAIHGINIDGGTLYCTQTPCMICAKMLVNSGVKEIVTYKDYADEESINFLKNAGVKMRRLPRPNPVIKFKD